MWSFSTDIGYKGDEGRGGGGADGPFNEFNKARRTKKYEAALGEAPASGEIYKQQTFRMPMNLLSQFFENCASFKGACLRSEMELFMPCLQWENAIFFHKKDILLHAFWLHNTDKCKMLSQI